MLVELQLPKDAGLSLKTDFQFPPEFLFCGQVSKANPFLKTRSCGSHFSGEPLSVGFVAAEEDEMVVVLC